MSWTAIDVAIVVDDAGTSDPVVTATLVTPAGDLLVMSEPTWSASTLTLDGLHMHGLNLAPRELGVVHLRWLAQAVMERLELDEIVIQGAVRTSGANPGRRPSEKRFKRKSATAPE